MRLFDIEPYELPTEDSVDWLQTKYAVGVFLATYKTNRERMGYNSVPKLTQNGELIRGEKLRDSFYDSLVESNFLYTESCFEQGFTAIMHAYRPEVTERRRKIFFYRYLYGLSVPLVSERINYQKNIIIDDSKQGIIQFSRALSLLVLK